MTEATTEAKPLTVLGNMDSRRLFNTTDEALAYLAKCQAEYSDFANYPIAIAGQTDEGELDPEVYNESMRVAVSVLTKRGDGPNSTTVQAICLYPQPSLAAVLESTTGTTWLTDILEKELNHVAVRGLRKAESDQDILDAVAAMPTTLDAYTTSGRESSSGVLETYNTLWQLIKKAVGAKSKAFALRNFSKKELRRAMESASYAAANHPQLENRVGKNGESMSLFVVAATFGQQLAKRDSLDPAFFDRVLATRNEKVIEMEDEADDFDFDSLAKVIAEKPADAPTEELPATDDAPAA